jgi:glucosamine--fructose-6-phosphate aminotransferase (isomerizing)
VWVIAPPDDTRERLMGNLHEVRARGARLFAIADANDTELAALTDDIVPLPPHPPSLSPLLTVVPLQLFAYHVACALGRNVDRPRNLAKSVTVL